MSQQFYHINIKNGEKYTFGIKDFGLENFKGLDAYPFLHILIREVRYISIINSVTEFHKNNY